MKKYIKSSRYPKYDRNDGWTQEDIELHQSIDWGARNYAEYEVPEDYFMSNAILFGPNGAEEQRVKFIKVLRANPIFPPYYRPATLKPFDVDFPYVGPMYNGNWHGKYQIHDRFESQDMYDLLSR